VTAELTTGPAHCTYGPASRTTANALTHRYRNDTVSLNWTQSDPSTDTFPFRALLSNEDPSILSNPQGIADSSKLHGSDRSFELTAANASATFVRIALPQLRPACAASLSCGTYS
jgi:hypothetical protein